jgi:hypothetical protein
VAAISFGLFELFLTSIVFCVVTVAVVRKLGRREAWFWWMIALSAGVALVLIRGGGWVWSLGNPLVTIYVWAMVWCLPTAAAVWASTRAATRANPPGPIGHFARTYGMFILGGILGVVLGVIPDIARMF